MIRLRNLFQRLYGDTNKIIHVTVSQLPRYYIMEGSFMEKQVAILIDGDNVSSKYAEYIKQEALHYGNVKIFRLYGSITSPSVRNWYKVMPIQGIVPMLQITYANGKSIADQALTIDAMDLLYCGDVDVFCIISSDSDFTKLVYRLKEAGKTVIGMGEKKTKEALAKACDEFKILDLIYKEAGTESEENISEDTVTEDIEALTVSADEKESIDEDMEEKLDEVEISIPAEDEIIAYICGYMDEDESVNLAEIGSVLKQKFLGFDARNYGYKSMTNMVKNNSKYFDLEIEDASDGIHKIMYLRKK